MTYEEAVAYLEQSASFGIKPGLERIEGILDILGRPEKAYKTIHVTGTNGKGSVTAYIDSVLTNSGRRVGRYTSPHLISYTERMCINGRDITPEAFGAVVAQVATAVTTYVNGGGEPPTQFEILTAAAFLFFKEQAVDYAVIEVGLGGLLDSTNVIVPEVAVITNVTVDHKKYCGDTPAEIAKHKAGIIKAGVPVITAAQGEPLGVIMAEAELKKAPLLIFNKAFAVESRRPMKGCQMITLGTAPKLPVLAELGIREGTKALLLTKLAGVHQAVNLACAAMAVRVLMKHDEAITEETMREGLACTTWPGRFEVITALKRTFILDGAHNAGGAESFQLTYAELFTDTPKTLITAILADKEEEEIISRIVGAKDTVFTVPAPTPRSEDPEVLAKRIGPKATALPSVAAGLDAAMKITKDGDIIAVAGSLYILGEVEQWLATHVGS